VKFASPCGPILTSGVDCPAGSDESEALSIKEFALIAWGNAATALPLIFCRIPAVL